MSWIPILLSKFLNYDNLISMGKTHFNCPLSVRCYFSIGKEMKNVEKKIVLCSVYLWFHSNWQFSKHFIRCAVVFYVYHFDVCDEWNYGLMTEWMEISHSTCIQHNISKIVIDVICERKITVWTVYSLKNVSTNFCS